MSRFHFSRRSVCLLMGMSAQLASPDRKSASPLAPELERALRKPDAPPDEGHAASISDSSGLPPLFNSPLEE